MSAPDAARRRQITTLWHSAAFPPGTHGHQIHHLQGAAADRRHGPQLYADHALTLALHPSETEERLMVRLLAFALNVPARHRPRRAAVRARPVRRRRARPLAARPDRPAAALDRGRPARRAPPGQGLRPRRARHALLPTAARAGIWWAGIRNKLTRLSNLAVWQIPAEQARPWPQLALRGMQLQVTVQDGQVWVEQRRAVVELPRSS